MSGEYFWKHQERSLKTYKMNTKHGYFLSFTVILKFKIIKNSYTEVKTFNSQKQNECLLVAILLCFTKLSQIYIDYMNKYKWRIVPIF